MVTAYTRPWKTEDEIDFIDRIGCHSIQPDATRVQLLQRYEAALKARKDWAALDQNEILSHIGKLIRKEISHV